MKLAYASDLHLERMSFEEELPLPTEEADVLLLVGDIITLIDGKFNNLYHIFFNHCSKQYKSVLMIMGNHEHYLYDFNKTYETIKNELKQYDNVHLLENEHIIIDNVLFFGATLWTDINNRHPITLLNNMMNDYVHINYDNRKLLTNDTLNQNELSTEKLKEVYKYCVDNDLTIVIMTHHAPIMMRTNIKDSDYYYYNTKLDNFLMHMDEFIWIHGHTHEEYVYELRFTEDNHICCILATNARGYHDLTDVSNFKYKTLEIDNENFNQ